MQFREFFSKNKILIISLSSILLILVIVGVTFFFLNRNSQNTNNQNNNSNNSNNNQNSSLGYLPANICPDNNNVFVENGRKRADYQGMQYIVSDEGEAWVNSNCRFTQPTQTMTQSPTMTMTPSTVNEPAPPLLLKGVGFNLDNYNATTLKAGDLKFTKVKLQFDQIISPFGQPDPRNPNSGQKNPQTVFILPLGTNVLSLVDGEVVEVKQIYSNDYTIMIAKSKQSQWFYETEHVNNPKVKVGDKVTAGQVLGVVSDYDSKNNPGFGLVEIGILHSIPFMPPQHVCPFAYLDPSVKDSINSKFSNIYTAWEKYLGKEVYKQETFKTPGCVVETPVEG